ncbi:MAG: SusC/RagA family TonB-linked outer membrane protein [Bacteroidales bacterium]|nr:SusC/RagA family TonB-linked outer membrane protein [Bacteroidales bacterium]
MRSILSYSLKAVLVAVLMCAGIAMSAQTIAVKGVIRDASNGEAVSGAIVQLQGSNTVYATSDLDGNYSINVPANGTISVSLLGYVGQTIQVAGRNVINITLAVDSEMLEDVVVVGYGTMRRTDLTGSSTSLKTEDLTAAVVANPITALQGKSAGVAVFTNNKPGSAPGIRIRGTGTITSSSAPLYVVDGFPLTDGNLNDILASDIQSMEILKDASSTAIYGSRGANGVVLITTKQGAKDTKNLTVNINNGIQFRDRLMDMLTGQEYLDYFGETAPKNGVWTDWQREIISHHALTQDYNISFDGHSGSTNYMISGGYYNQKGLILDQGYRRASVHSNLTHKFNDWLTVGSSIQFTNGIQDRGVDNAVGEIGRMGFPNQPVRNADGSWNILTGAAVFNPVAQIAATNAWSNSARFLGSFYAEAKILKHLTYKLSFGYDMRNTRGYSWTSSQAPGNILNNSEGSGSHSWGRGVSRVLDNILTYQNQWGQHRFTATGVYSYQDYDYQSTSVGAKGDNDKLEVWSIGGKDPTVYSHDSNRYGNKIISFTGRINYSYADKYILTATARYDGSSRFGKNSKWGLFPSVGLAWRPTQEDFLKDNEVITDMKLRASWGITGNQEIGNYMSLSRLSTGAGNSYNDGDNYLTGYGEGIGNGDLRWEKTTQINLGFDVQLWNRMNVVFDWYDRTTSDLLYNVPIPSTSGFSTLLSNVGVVGNRGIELTISGDIVRTRDLLIDASVNFTTNTNQIKALYGSGDYTVTRQQVTSGNTGIANILEVGKPVNGVWTRHSLGIIHNQAELDKYLADQTAYYAEMKAQGKYTGSNPVPAFVTATQLGDEVFEDVNGDGSINTNDYICIGSTEPKYYYGLNFNLAWKGLTFSVYGQGAWNYASIIGDEDRASASIGLGSYANTGNYVFNADNVIAGNNYIPTTQGYHAMWSTTNVNGTSPRRGFNGYLSDRTNGNWWYFVVRNIQLGYDFSNIMHVKGIKGLALNVNLQNFFSFTTPKNRGYNPENGDVSNPWAKTVLIGVSAKF